MADFYPYLVASLPILHFGMKPPFSHERFLDVCFPFIPKKDFQLLHSLPRPEHYSEKDKRHPVIQKWIEFDSTLRNELARARAIKKHIEPAMYLRSGSYSVSSPLPAIIAATQNSSVLDAERILDETRWKVLEELTTGHYFDLAVLITYAYQLSILQRWENIRSADETYLLEQALQR